MADQLCTDDPLQAAGTFCSAWRTERQMVRRTSMTRSGETVVAAGRSTGMPGVKTPNHAGFLSPGAGCVC